MKWVLVAVTILALSAVSFVGYQAYGKIKQSEAEAVKTIAELTENLARATEENETLMSALAAEQEKMHLFEEQIEEITGTVGILDRLQKTDKELLQKYSKTYFLNEHYRPSGIEEIPSKYRSPAEDDEYFHEDAYSFLENLLEAAEDDDVSLLVASGYRSFDEQKDVKSSHTVVYGTAANQFSADQGYSEHQLGTTIDFTTESLAGALNGFEKTEAYSWLKKNAHTYGFILSYPEGNTYYQFEPWHWRFVGVDLAKRLYRTEKHFYDLDQREIDEYLVDLFN